MSPPCPRCFLLRLGGTDEDEKMMMKMMMRMLMLWVGSKWQVWPSWDRLQPILWFVMGLWVLLVFVCFGFCVLFCFVCWHSLQNLGEGILLRVSRVWCWFLLALRSRMGNSWLSGTDFHHLLSYFVTRDLAESRWRLDQRKIGMVTCGWKRTDISCGGHPTWRACHVVLSCCGPGETTLGHEPGFATRSAHCMCIMWREMKRRRTRYWETWWGKQEWEK